MVKKVLNHDQSSRAHAKRGENYPRGSDCMEINFMPKEKLLYGKLRTSFSAYDYRSLKCHYLKFLCLLNTQKTSLIAINLKLMMQNERNL